MVEFSDRFIDCPDGVYIVAKGCVIDVLEPKEYGQDSLYWQHGKVFEVVESKRRRVCALKRER